MVKEIVVEKNGIGFLSVLALVLIVLKLLGYITVSWWLVFLPVYICTALTVGVFLLAAIAYALIASLVYVVDKFSGKGKSK